MSKSHTPESLVKYETPILVSSAFKSKKEGNKALPQVSVPNSKQTTEDFLNMILPPQEIVDNNQLWVRYVSPTPATTADVTNLQKDLDKRTIQMEARDCGICPIREELYAQCFDELIRQITINCAERGHLLLRVRDEIRMYKETLQGLYDSSIAYGLKKALVAEQRKKDIHNRIAMLEKENKDLEAECVAMEDRGEQLQLDAKEELERLTSAHNVEKKELRDQIVLAKFELDKVLSSKIM